MRSDARKRLAEATFAPISVRQAEVEELVRQAKADAWDEGMYFGRGFEQEGRGHAPIVNPYRVGGAA